MGLMKKLTSAVVASSLVLSLAAPVLAEVTADDAQAAYARLNYYGIAEGILREDGTKDPALDENLTRAQLVAMIVKAFGQKEYAEMLAGAQTFSDVPTSHWASGYLAIAKNIAAQNGNTIGYPDGTFGPENNVTAIEALAFVLKFLGVQVPGGDNWVEATIAAAKNAGVITDADVEKYLANPNEPATRGLAFAMADSIFYNYNGLDGKSVYTKYRDTEAPVVSLDPAPATTEKATIEITGKVSGDYREVYVGSDAITVAEDGTFSAQVKLDLGTNTIEVSAKDWAGNVGSAKLVIERVAGQAAKIQIVAPEGPVVAGSTIDLPVLVVDAEGADTGLTDVTVDAGEAGTWAEGKLTAATKAGKYTITASYEGLETATVEIEIVAGPLAKVEAETKSVKPGTAVKLIGVDQYGNKVEGVTFAEAEDYAEAFIEGDLFIATKPGTYKVVGTKGEGEEAVKAEGTVSVFGEHASFDIVIEDELVANGATEYEVKVVAVDKDGNAVTDFDGEVTLDTNVDLVSGDKVEAEDGVATFKVKVPVGMEGLEAEFTATYTDSQNDVEIEATESFEIKAQVATKIELKADKYLAINDPAFSGSVRILDQLGKPMESGDTYEVTLTISGPAYFEDTTDKELVVEASGGSLPFAIEPVDKYTEGTITITASAEGLTSATAEVTAAFAMAPKNLAINHDTTSARKAGTTSAQEWVFRVGLTDRNGVPVRADDDYDITLVFDHEDADDELTVTIDGSPATLDDGEVDATLNSGDKNIEVRVKSKGIVGDVKVTAKAKNLTSASGTISFKAGDLYSIAFTKGTDVNVLADTEYELTVQLQDEAENPVAKSGVKVEFSVDDASKDYADLGRGFGKDYTAYTDAEGKATVKVRVLDYSTGTVTLSAKASGADFAGLDFTDINLHIVKSVAKSIRVTTHLYDGKSASSVAAGNPILVRAEVTDQRGIKVGPSVFDGATQLQLSGIKGSETKEGALSGFTWNATESVWETYLTPIKAKSYNLTVKDSSSVTDVKGTRGFTVVADTATGLAYDGEKITYEKGKVKEVVLYVVDAYGNKVPASKVSGSIVDEEFEVEIVKGDGTYGIVSSSANGGGTDTLQVKIKQYTNSYKVYIVTDADNDAQLKVGGETIPLELSK